MPCGVAPEVASETARSRIASCRGTLKGGARAHAHPTAPKSFLVQVVGFIQRKATSELAAERHCFKWIQVKRRLSV
jgi:hypothetical protein